MIRSILSLKRFKITVCNLEAWKKGNDYLSLPPIERLKWIPPPRENLETPAAFLSLIGRSMDKYAPKFTNLDELLTLSSSKLQNLGLKVSDRKYLISCREWYKRGMNLPKALVKSRPKKRKNKA